MGGSPGAAAQTQVQDRREIPLIQLPALLHIVVKGAVVHHLLAGIRPINQVAVFVEGKVVDRDFPSLLQAVPLVFKPVAVGYSAFVRDKVLEVAVPVPAVRNTEDIEVKVPVLPSFHRRQEVLHRLGVGENLPVIEDDRGPLQGLLVKGGCQLPVR